MTMNGIRPRPAMKPLIVASCGFRSCRGQTGRYQKWCNFRVEGDSPGTEKNSNSCRNSRSYFQPNSFQSNFRAAIVPASLTTIQRMSPRRKVTHASLLVHPVVVRYQRTRPAIIPTPEAK